MRGGGGCWVWRVMFDVGGWRMGWIEELVWSRELCMNRE